VAIGTLISVFESFSAGTALRPGDKLVLACLAFHQNSRSGLCCPSLALLARETGKSMLRVRESIKRLCACGLLSVTFVAGKSLYFSFHLLVLCIILNKQHLFFS